MDKNASNSLELATQLMDLLLKQKSMITAKTLKRTKILKLTSATLQITPMSKKHPLEMLKHYTRHRMENITKIKHAIKRVNSIQLQFQPLTYLDLT